MKNNLKTVGMILAVPALVFLCVRCGSEEKPGDTAKKTTEAVKVQKKGVKAKMKKKGKPVLPKRLLELGLDENQLAACEAAYIEIFTPEVQKKKNEMYKKLKAMEKGSEAHKAYRAEVMDSLKPYRQQFRKKLKELLTEEQQAIYLKKPEKKEEEKKKEK